MCMWDERRLYLSESSERSAERNSRKNIHSTATLSLPDPQRLRSETTWQEQQEQQEHFDGHKAHLPQWPAPVRPPRLVAQFHCGPSRVKRTKYSVHILLRRADNHDSAALHTSPPVFLCVYTCTRLLEAPPRPVSRHGILTGPGPRRNATYLLHGSHMSSPIRRSGLRRPARPRVRARHVVASLSALQRQSWKLSQT
jgi:hypothetical protein